MKNTTTPFHSLVSFFNSNKGKDPGRILQPEVYRSVKDESTLRSAAVLLPITRHKPGFESNLVLTVRSENLTSHAGQISLPGGTQEDHDDDLVATALRETEEEIGLKSKEVEIIGRLGTLALPSGYLVSPIAGLIDNDLDFTPQPEEVAHIFQAPLKLILNVNAYKKSSVSFKGIDQNILELQYENYRIWGATAAILYHLARKITDFENLL